MRTIRTLFENDLFQTILGFILLFTVISIIVYLIYTALYWTAWQNAEKDAGMKLEQHKRELESECEQYKQRLIDEFEEYKRNIHVNTNVSVCIEKGVGYTENTENTEDTEDTENTEKTSRQQRIRRIV